jgi:hypothetical protein
VVAVLQRACEQLIVRPGQRDGAQRAVQLRADALLGMRCKAAKRDLLAGEDGLCRQERCDLLRVRDVAGHDRAFGDVGGDHQVTLDQVGARRALGHVPLRDVHLDGALALANVALVVCDVERREKRCDEREPDSDGDVAEAVGHVCGYLVSR